MLQVTLTNNSGETLVDPIEIAFDFPVKISPRNNNGFFLNNSGLATTHISGQLAEELTPVENGQSVTFLINIGSSNGSLSENTLPSDYLIDDTPVSEYDGETPAPDTTPPSIPEGLRVTEITKATTKVVWNPSTDTQSASDHYLVIWSDVPSTLGNMYITVKDKTSATISGLKPGQRYSFTVLATDTAGNQTTWRKLVLWNTLSGEADASSVTALNTNINI